MLPDFQGIGLGWRLSEVIAARYASTGRRLVSITMHPTFGKGRDRSERWRPKPRNHTADKDEATLNAASRAAHQAAGTWAPTARARLRPSYRHEYVGAPGAERDAFLRAASRLVPPHKCKDEVFDGVLAKDVRAARRARRKRARGGGDDNDDDDEAPAAKGAFAAGSDVEAFHHRTQKWRGARIEAANDDGSYDVK